MLFQTSWLAERLRQCLLTRRDAWLAEPSLTIPKRWLEVAPQVDPMHPDAAVAPERRRHRSETPELAPEAEGEVQQAQSRVALSPIWPVLITGARETRHLCIRVLVLEVQILNHLQVHLSMSPQ